jgi:hypothetical protein
LEGIGGWQRGKLQTCQSKEGGQEISGCPRLVLEIFEINELDPNSTCAKNAQVAADGNFRQIDLYNLDVIIKVGYRVNSIRGTQFRIWATQVLRDYQVRGYFVNAKRPKELQQSLKLVGQILFIVDCTVAELSKQEKGIRN